MAKAYKFEGGFGFRIRFWLRRFARVFLFWKEESELGGFLELYAMSGVSRVSGEERARLPQFQKCQACSLCTFSCTAVREGTAPPSFEPKSLLLGIGRLSLADSTLADWVPCAACGRCIIQCPNDVPIHEVAQSVIDRKPAVVALPVS